MNCCFIIQLQEFVNHMLLINSKDNFIHIFDTNYHLIVNLLQFIPNELNNLYPQRNNKLIQGYIRKVTQKMNLSTIFPKQLTKLVSLYHPSFFYH